MQCRAYVPKEQTVISTNNPPPSPDKVDSRVTLALERTLLAWTRTALAVMGFGFVVARLPVLVGELTRVSGVAGPQVETPRWLGIATIALGVAIQMIALITHVQSVHRIRHGDEIRLKVVSPAYVVGLMFVAAGVSLAIYLSGVF